VPWTEFVELPAQQSTEKWFDDDDDDESSISKAMTNANVEKNDKERKNTKDTNHTPKLTITKIEISIGE